MPVCAYVMVWILCVVMTALQDLKYAQWFRGADVDGDGFITQRDVRMMSERYITARGTAPDSATARLLTGQMDGFWANVIAPMDQDGDGKVDLREMTEGFRRVLTDPALYPEQIEPVTDCFFDLVDLNGDGKIDQAEFQQMFDSVAGVPGEDCAAVFTAWTGTAPVRWTAPNSTRRSRSSSTATTRTLLPTTCSAGSSADGPRCGLGPAPTPPLVWACGVKTSGQDTEQRRMPHAQGSEGCSAQRRLLKTPCPPPRPRVGCRRRRRRSTRAPR